MSRLPLILLAALALPALAAKPVAPRPPELIPVPEEEEGAIPLIAPQGANEPEISIRTEGDTTVEEYRRDGRVYMMRVKPGIGPAYYLIDPRGDGNFLRHDGPLPPTAPAQWRIYEF